MLRAGPRGGSEMTREVAQQGVWYWTCGWCGERREGPVGKLPPLHGCDHDVGGTHHWQCQWFPRDEDDGWWCDRCNEDRCLVRGDGNVTPEPELSGCKHETGQHRWVRVPHEHVWQRPEVWHCSCGATKPETEIALPVPDEAWDADEGDEDPS